MEEAREIRVVAADRMDFGLIISFNDGRCGRYSSELLYSMLAAAEELHESDDVPLEETPPLR